MAGVHELIGLGEKRIARLKRENARLRKQLANLTSDEAVDRAIDAARKKFLIERVLDAHSAMRAALAAARDVKS